MLGLPRTVVVLGLVSFLNDTASDMIAPLLPLFLTATLGAGPAVVGLVEGVAEATASLLKLLSGRLADRGWPANARPHSRRGHFDRYAVAPAPTDRSRRRTTLLDWGGPTNIRQAFRGDMDHRHASPRATRSCI